MIGLVAICVLKSWKELVKKGWLRIGIILTFEGWAVVIRYFAWNAWERSFIRGWQIGRGRNGGSIGGGGIRKISYSLNLNKRYEKH